MEENVLMNEEIVEGLEKTTENVLGGGSKIKFGAFATGIGASIVCGALAYKFIIKPIMVKRKNKKNQEADIEIVEDPSDENEE